MDKKSIIRSPIYLIPFFLISGPFIPDLILSLSSLFFLIFIIFKQKKNYLYYNFFIFFFIFWLFISINSVLSQDLASIKSSLTYFRFGIFLLLVQFLFDNDIRFIENFRKVIFFSILILFIDSIFQFTLGQNILGYPKDGRISSFFGDEKILGSYIIKFVPIYIALYFFDKKEIKFNYYIFFVLLISLILIMMSSERSALGLFLLYTTIISSILFKKIKNFFAFVSVLFIFIFILLLNVEQLKQRYIVTLINQFKVVNINASKTDTNNKFYYFTEAHHEMMLTSLNIFKDKPLTGYGTKTFREKCKLAKYNMSPANSNGVFKGCNTHPHNYYLQMLAENGIVGFIFLIFIFFYFLFLFFKNLLYKNKAINLIIASNIVCFWPLIPHGNFFNNWISIVIFLNLSIYIVFRKKFFKDSN